MGLTCGKEKFEVGKSTQFTSQGDGFYRTFEQLSYWDSAKNGKSQIERENNTENRSVASTIPMNGNGRSEGSSYNDIEESKNAMKIINE